MVILIHDDDTDLYIPCCFVLRSHKNTEIYEKIFKDIKEYILNNAAVERITIDFEDALKESLRRVFPEVVCIGCKFHFNQAMIRKAKKKGFMNSNFEKDTKYFLYKLNKILEAGVDDFEKYLCNLENDIENELKSETITSGKVTQYNHSLKFIRRKLSAK